MRRVSLLVAFVAAGFAVTRAAADDAKNDIEGTWELVSIERDGNQLKLEGPGRMVSKAGKFEVKFGDKVVVAGTAKLDSTKKPKTVDVTYTEGPDKGKSFKGIYTIDGDTAKFCRPLSPDAERPAKIDSKDGHVVMVYKRVKD